MTQDIYTLLHNNFKELDDGLKSGFSSKPKTPFYDYQKKKDLEEIDLDQPINPVSDTVTAPQSTGLVKKGADAVKQGNANRIRADLTRKVRGQYGVENTGIPASEFELTGLDENTLRSMGVLKKDEVLEGTDIFGKNLPLEGRYVYITKPSRQMTEIEGTLMGMPDSFNKRLIQFVNKPIFNIKGIQISAPDIVGIGMLAYGGKQLVSKVGQPLFNRAIATEEYKNLARQKGMNVTDTQVKQWVDWTEKNVTPAKFSNTAWKNFFKSAQFGGGKAIVPGGEPLKPEIAKSAQQAGQMITAGSLLPFQMTQGQFIETALNEYTGGERVTQRQFATESIKQTHKQAVQKALSEGKEVPPEVLKDYPELKGQDVIKPRSNDLLLTARNMTESGSQRIGQTDWTVSGNKVIASHSVTGREYGEIDLTTGEIMAHRPQDSKVLQGIKDVITKEAQDSAIQQEIGNLKNYPARNQKQIQNLENQLVQSLPPSTSVQTGEGKEISEMTQDEWNNSLRFYRSGSLARAETPSGEKVILKPGSTPSNFKELNADFLKGVRANDLAKSKPTAPTIGNITLRSSGE